MRTPNLIMNLAGYKAGKLYSSLPTDGTGDFTFSRASSATRVNSEGLIEEVLSNVPRLNYPMIDGVVSGCPSLLLEPQRTNLVTYSEDFSSSWILSGTNPPVLTPLQFISPDGTQNASRLQIPITNTISIMQQAFSHTSGTKYTVSAYVKSNVSTNQQFKLYGDFGSPTGISDVLTATSEWQRFTFTYTATGTGSRSGGFYYVPNTKSDIQIYGFQAEQGSYATSYIPTSGSAVTRVADFCNNGGNEQVFNDSEGVIYVETQPFIDGDYQSLYISLSDNTTGSNFITIQHRNNGQFRVYAGSFTTIIYLQDIDLYQNLKIALQYKNVTDFKLYINGTLYPIYETPTNSAFVGLSTLDFKLRGSTSGYWAGQVRDTKYFDKALTDAQLQALTQ